MKKLTALFLMLSICVVVMGCGGETGSSSKPSTAKPTTPEKGK